MATAQRQIRPQQTYMAQQGMARHGPSGLAEVLDVLLDKGLVIDAFVRVSLVGIELLTIDARVVIASVDTYLRFAEAVNRLDLLDATQSQTLGDVLGSGKRSSRASRDEDRSDDDANESHALSASVDDGEPEQRKPERPASEGNGNEERSSDDKGLLTKIKERGQVF